MTLTSPFLSSFVMRITLGLSCRSTWITWQIVPSLIESGIFCYMTEFSGTLASNSSKVMDSKEAARELRTAKTSIKSELYLIYTRIYFPSSFYLRDDRIK